MEIKESKKTGCEKHGIFKAQLDLSSFNCDSFHGSCYDLVSFVFGWKRNFLCRRHVGADSRKRKGNEDIKGMNP